MQIDIFKVAPYAWRAVQRRAEIGLLQEDLTAIYEKAKPAIAEARLRWPEIEQIVRTLLAHIMPEWRADVIDDRGLWQPDVRWVQQELKKRGFYAGPIDGKYGDGTFDAVKKAQRSFGFDDDDVDGLAGMQTIGALLAHPHTENKTS